MTILKLSLLGYGSGSRQSLDMDWLLLGFLHTLLLVVLGSMRSTHLHVSVVRKDDRGILCLSMVHCLS